MPFVGSYVTESRCVEIEVKGYVVGDMRAGWGPGEHWPWRWPVRRRAPHLKRRPPFPPARPTPRLTFVRFCPAELNYPKLSG